MAPPPPVEPNFDLPPLIRDLLNSVRRQVWRQIGWLESARVLALATLMFLVAWGLDYLPIWLGFRELPRWFRGVLLASLVIGFLPRVVRGLWQWSRTRVTDQSVALLIERRLPELRNGLLTLLDASRNRDPMNPHTPALLAGTLDRVLPLLQAFDPDRLFERRFRNRWLVLAGTGVLFLGMLGTLFPASLTTAAKRWLLLANQTYPRQYTIELVGIRARPDRLQDEFPEGTRLREFAPHSTLHVAQGESLTLFAHVRVPESATESPEAPRCELIYQSAVGGSGRVLLKRLGNARDQVQRFDFSGAPLEKLGNDLRFWVRCGDACTDPLRLVVAPPPAVVETNLDCTFPQYMVDRESLRWTPRTLPWTPGTKLPIGTQLSVQCRSSVPLAHAYLAIPNAEHPDQPYSLQNLEPAADRFEFKIPALSGDLAARLYLVDQHGVVSQEPFLFSLEAVSDQAPRISSRLEGIGMAITPQALLPIRGMIDDDYGVEQSWLEVQANAGPAHREPLALTSAGEIESMLDLREWKSRQEDLQLEAGPEQSLTLVVKAVDRYDLQAKPNESAGDTFKLDLVSPNELLRLLERRESAERRRLEQIHEELGTAREFLLRIAGSSPQLPSERLEPGDVPQVSPGPRDSLEQVGETRRIYVSRLRNQLEKSANEISGTIASFDNLRSQMVNNRLNAREREIRLADQVVAPLKQIVDELRGSLKDQGRALQQRVQESTANRDRPQTDAASLSADMQRLAGDLQRLHERLQEIILLLVKFETQNELLDMVRGMLQLQKELHQKTQDLRKKDAFEGLID